MVEMRVVKGEEGAKRGGEDNYDRVSDGKMYIDIAQKSEGLG